MIRSLRQAVIVAALFLCCRVAITAQEPTPPLDEPFAIGHELVLGEDGRTTVLAKIEKDAQPMQFSQEADMEAMVKSKDDGDWLASAERVQKLDEQIKAGVANGVLIGIKMPTKARVISVKTSDQIVERYVYQVEVLEGPLKGDRYYYCFWYDQGSLRFYEPGFLYRKNKDRPVTSLFAFEKEEYKSYMHAEDIGDTDTMHTLKSLGRVWEVPMTTTGKVIRKDSDIFHVRIEVTSGPFKGRKGWGLSFDINRVPAPASKVETPSPKAGGK